ncbi:hypothetical protein BEWA_029440 [Theileria equi strain WA]|uniref:Uncharacterized protein n=1 Tax=Theileria equi strain WA TaxID=1537102 RepID=L0AYX2_THEEQ|nr:hypothetical protein BEWA_029440 [Theileria equi strain WA]AFZ80094.1 hypothetical protein BEWA_029440 [Theileria equi strain WA]|eukprot:XP_004829760.1 hypothetical protein BEWA_029440 [Theileria equi strain WA]
MVVSIQQKERVKKTALFFAGLGHLQPMLLAATNSDYLLDRFLVERRCSSEYVSRTITSLIFVEIIATVLMGGFAVCLGLWPDYFKGISREKEEDFRGYLTVAIQWVLFLGYLQILKAFTSGGERGHIQWFYYSLLFQHFFTCIIGAGIGFIDVDRALWYLMNIPMSPVLIFFYQMLIHMWARKNGLACPAYLVVKNQIWLAILNSFMATVLWTIAYFPGLYNSQSIPDVVEIKIELDKTDGYYPKTPDSIHRDIYMDVTQGSSLCQATYTCYVHTLNRDMGPLKDKKFIVKEIYCGGSSIKNVSFPEHEFCTYAEVYQSKESGKRCLLVKLLMEDGSAYYYANPEGTCGRWCVGKLPSSHKVEDIGKILKETNNCGSSQIKDSGDFQAKLLSQASQPGVSNKTTSYADEIVLNISNTTNYVCESEGSKKTDIIVTVAKDENLVPSVLRGQYSCYTHRPSVKRKLDKTLKYQNGRPYPLDTMSDNTFERQNVDHVHVYCKISGNRADLLVIVMDDGSRHYYCRNNITLSTVRIVGTKLEDTRKILLITLLRTLRTYGSLTGQKGLTSLNTNGNYSADIKACKPTPTSSGSSHSLTLDLGNKYPYICTVDNMKTLISLEVHAPGKDPPSGFCKYTHRMDSGSKFCLDSIKLGHNNTEKILDFRPCIQGLVDEVSAYYEKGNTAKPLLLCVKSDSSYYYYCKGSDDCWYRYKNGDGKEILPTGSDNNTGLHGLLEKLKGDPSKALTKDNFPNLSGDLKTRLQSDHPNYDYWKVLGNHDGGSPWNPLCWRLSGTFMPLAMHGLAVGAMGSIYPHLVPKTLVSAEHARIFNVVSMFLAAIVQILNLIFFECKSKAFANRPWEGGDKWYLTWLLYIPYFLSFLLIIFNIHYPDWSICCYVRSHTWLAFLIMLSVTFINDIFLAVGRGGIMDQRSGNRRLGGNREYLKNDHSLFNKIAPFMALSSVPFWLTTSPMIKSYAHAVCQLSDKDSWPTSCCGFWSSWGYWCKCGCHGLYTSLPKLLTFNMRTALAHKDDRLFILVTSDLPKEEWFTDW